MSATVGAALKKIAMALLGDPKILKKVVTVILVLILAVISPIFLIYGIFSGGIEMDKEKLKTFAEEALSEQEMIHLQQLDTTGREIETAMTNAGYTDLQVMKAHVLYVLVLYPHEEEGNLVSRLIGCFASEQTDEELISAVNEEFGTTIYADDFEKLVSSLHKKIVAVALTQLGNIGGEPYWSWYGMESRIEWCACFVSWCAKECGYIDAGVVPKFASCTVGMNWFKDKDQWSDNTITPSPGMLIFFDWDDDDGQDGLPNHVGIVERVENGVVHTIEGNSGDACRQRSYAVGYYEILGYASPAYGTDQG